MQRAGLMGADYLATGHYARIVHNGARSACCAADAGKDQSYVLYGLSQAQMARSSPDADRRVLRQGSANSHGRWPCLPPASQTARTSASSDGDYRGVHRARLAARPGTSWISSGRVLGRHGGVHPVHRRPGRGSRSRQLRGRRCS